MKFDLVISTFLFTVSSAFVVPPHRNTPRTTYALDMTAFTLEPKDTAFVFIEYQNEFTTEGGKLHDAVKPCMEKTNSEFENAADAVHAVTHAVSYALNNY